MEELVSIITPSYNSEKHIAETIKSVQSQTFSNWEMIIVDDASKDNTESIVLKFIETDNRIKFHKLYKNSGAGVARNHALLSASGRYIAFLDSDDLWKSEKLEKQIEFLKVQNAAFTFSFYECINDDGIPLNKKIIAPQKLYYWQLFFCNFVGNLTGIYDTHFFGKIPISNQRKRQDWQVWLTILRKTKTANPLPESLAFYRIRQNSISSSKIQLLRYNYNVYSTFHGFNTVVSLCCMFGFLFMQLFIKPLYCRRFKPTI
jgi:teichuronic acid biosynthesis glycosyltransferase TuaG